MKTDRIERKPEGMLQSHPLPIPVERVRPLIAAAVVSAAT